eukprot:TRINITY_DN10136_c0_g1_i1.p1 TRINITY_DN10136_c0_g1~~TRINITY_DN10136_c0_g1_i1.p1  ORF type:complete len:514 (-),score=192.35 TRINITY_DN10136_c0_g1_i1:227-1768(-)
MASFSISDLPVSILTDSYKVSHWLQYPPDTAKMVAYGEFRGPFDGIKTDNRFVFYGIRYIVETYLNRRWTRQDVERAALFYSTHNAAYSGFPFPKDLFMKVVDQHDGYFPVKVEALPEGSVVHVHTPVYQITAEGEYARLATFFETLLTQVWYPTTVATLSRMTKDAIEEAFAKSVDADSMGLADSRLHDFGFRGCTGVEQSVLGGAAHLLNFTGSDTLSACFYVQFHLNNGKPVGTSVPATEHSVMTAWRTEREAIVNMLDKFGGGVFATVMDSYDYKNALDNVVPSVKAQKVAKGGLWLFRPDSGDPVEAVLMALRAGDKTFGHTVNSKGFKVLNGVAAIQGDGINKASVGRILDAVLAEGFSAQCVAFGMGGGLLQKVNRDTMQFATKLSFIQYADGSSRDVMKAPKTDSAKTSLPGILRVQRDAAGLELVLPRDAHDTSYVAADLLRPVYDHKPIDGIWDDFDTIRKRVQTEWHRAPKLHDPVGPQIKQKIHDWLAAHKKMMAAEVYNG